MNVLQLTLCRPRRRRVPVAVCASLAIVGAELFIDIALSLCR